MGLRHVPSKTCAILSHKCKSKARKGTDKRRDSPEYWEKRLAACGLSMDRASRLGQEHIIYGSEVAVLDFFTHKHYELIGERQDTNGDETV